LEKKNTPLFCEFLAAQPAGKLKMHRKYGISKRRPAFYLCVGQYI